MAAGVPLLDAYLKVTTLVREKHAAGTTVTASDLLALFDDGDTKERILIALLDKAVADPNTPKLTA